MTTQTKALIEETRNKYSEDLGDHPTRISVTDTKRWGYVRKNGSIVFNWQIAALPPKLAEFVIIHELVHLSHLNHQRGFHVKMTQIIPDYRQRERELQNYIAIEPNFEFRTDLD